MIIFNTLQLDVWRRYASEDRIFNSIILGMSHAKSDIKLSQYFDNAFSFAGPSMDLFCHREIIKFLCKSYSQQMSKLQTVIIELPYYTFNYDLSSFKNFFLTKISYFHTFENYHNYTNKEYIQEFNLFEKMFLRKMESQTYIADENVEYEMNSNSISLKKKIYHLVDMFKVMNLHEKVWESDFISTKQENIEIFKELIDLIKKTNQNIKIVIVVAPFNPLFRISHKSTIIQRKKEFYDCVKIRENSISIIDLFDSMDRSKDFLDHCHLNKAGSIKWTRILNEKMRKI